VRRLTAREVMDGTIIGHIPKKVYLKFFQELDELMILGNVLNRLSKLLDSSTYSSIKDLVEKQQKERSKLWRSVDQYLKILTMTYYQVDENGDIYAINKEYPYNKKEKKHMKNIYDNKPKDGTVIGKVTTEELDAIIELDIKFKALDQLSNFAQGRFNLEEFNQMYDMLEKLERKKLEVWTPVYKRLNASYEWDIFVDYANGTVYVQNYELPYHEEKE
jgi:tRNA nucleotidyltransferase/poly(A) polymerase